MKAIFSLPFVRSIPIYINHITSYNYTPYQLFSIKTFLFSWIYNFLSPSYYIEFLGNKEDDGNQQIYQLNLRIMNNGEVVEIEEHQWLKIDEIIKQIIDNYSSMCLLISPWTPIFSEKYKIPQIWIKQIIPLSVNDNIKMIKDGDFSGSLFIDLSQSDISTDQILTYDKIYENIKSNLIEQINNYWDQGIILSPSNNIINKWNLKHIKDDYYKPIWNNKRLDMSYSGIWNFLQTYDNEYFSKLEVTHNWVMRHYISKNIKNEKFYFDQYYLWIIINDYDHLIELENIIEKYEGLSEGRVLLLGFPSLSQAEKIEDKCHELNHNDTIIYNYDNPNSFYRLSIKLNIDDDESSVRQLLID